MFKNIRTYFLTSLASFITAIAFIGVSPQSIWIFYEPDIPEALK
ncbi:cyclic lactone autoinducer peptide [Tepidanaerobacter sp. GT38]|nr:cyclic lactone autoinducer peptide [Tepidanaerobacter sp. GT38]MCG1011918.1 cyclic lactone autoinducer peptide [Tepidanaerobacter sp. GT38]